MTNGHVHFHHHGSAASERRLWAVFLITALFLLVEVAAGILTGSLALLSDAGHMLTDVAAIGISIAAIRIGRRPADARRTYGYYRFEILAAALNAAVLIVVAAYIFYEAYHRFVTPQEIDAAGMTAVAVLGLVVNVAAIKLLAAGADENLNVKGAYLEVLADAVSSVAVIVAGALTLVFGWSLADPLVAAGIGIWVLPRALRLLGESVNILLEGVPEGMNLAAIEGTLAGVPGVRGVHELHVWAISSGKPSLTAHLVIDAETAEEQEVLAGAAERLRTDFGITHTTLQIEREQCAADAEACGLQGRREPAARGELAEAPHDHAH